MNAGRGPLISREEFERAYAERSGITVERLRELGRVVRRCRCGEEWCEGWKSVSRRSIDRNTPDMGS